MVLWACIRLAELFLPGRIVIVCLHFEILDSDVFYLQVIDTLCTECASLIEHHEKIQVLSAVHYNLGKTLLDVENIVALPHEAGSAEAMLREDVQLMQVSTSSCKSKLRTGVSLEDSSEVSD